MHSYFTKKRETFFQELEEDSIALIFAGQAPIKRGDERYPFSPDRNFYYLTGLDCEDSILFLWKNQKSCGCNLFIPRGNGVMAKWVGENISPSEATTSSGIQDVFYLDEFLAAFGTYIFRNKPKALYLDLEKREWDSLQTPSLAFAEEFFRKYPHIQMKDSYPIFAHLRERKEEWELSRIRQAISVTAEALLAMMEECRPGMMEYELEAYLDFIMKKKGLRHKAFEPIVASGKNATILHYVKNNTCMKDGDLVLIDCGVQVEYYNGDLTRTFPVNGKFSARQKAVYEIVLEGQKRVIDAIAPGLPFGRLNEILKEYYVEALKNLGLIQEDTEVDRYYYHGVSHYLGAETHDIGRYGERFLCPGMVLTVEPGLYIEEWDIGIRIEDDVLVTEKGHEVLSEGLLKTVEEIESFMAKGK